MSKTTVKHLPPEVEKQAFSIDEWRARWGFGLVYPLARTWLAQMEKRLCGKYIQKRVQRIIMNQALV